MCFVNIRFCSRLNFVSHPRFRKPNLYWINLVLHWKETSLSSLLHICYPYSIICKNTAAGYSLNASNIFFVQLTCSRLAWKMSKNAASISFLISSSIRSEPLQAWPVHLSQSRMSSHTNFRLFLKGQKHPVDSSSIFPSFLVHYSSTGLLMATTWLQGCQNIVSYNLCRDFEKYTYIVSII